MIHPSVMHRVHRIYSQKYVSTLEERRPTLVYRYRSTPASVSYPVGVILDRACVVLYLDV